MTLPEIEYEVRHHHVVHYGNDGFEVVPVNGVLYIHNEAAHIHFPLERSEGVLNGLESQFYCGG